MRNTRAMRALRALLVPALAGLFACTKPAEAPTPPPAPKPTAEPAKTSNLVTALSLPAGAARITDAGARAALEAHLGAGRKGTGRGGMGGRCWVLLAAVTIRQVNPLEWR